MNLIATLEIPMTSIVSESNCSDHWTKKRKRRIMHDRIIRMCWTSKGVRMKLPCAVKLSRVGPRKMDDDNLRGALKSIRDTIADLILPGMAKGRADGDVRIEWLYDQIKGMPGLRIDLYEKPKEENQCQQIKKKKNLL